MGILIPPLVTSAKRTLCRTPCPAGTFLNMDNEVSQDIIMQVLSCLHISGRRSGYLGNPKQKHKEDWIVIFKGAKLDNTCNIYRESKIRMDSQNGALSDTAMNSSTSKHTKHQHFITAIGATSHHLASSVDILGSRGRVRGYKLRWFLLVDLSFCQWDFQGSPIMGPPYGKLPILFPYHSHKNP